MKYNATVRSRAVRMGNITRSIKRLEREIDKIADDGHTLTDRERARVEALALAKVGYQTQYAEMQAKNREESAG